MRKKISLLLAFAVCFGLLTGCSRDEEKRTASEDAPARAEPSVSAEPTRYRAQYSAVTDERLTSALQNAALCGDDLFWFFALPLKWDNADGSPIRALAFWED